MNYQETLNYLFTSTPVFEKIGAEAYKPGLDTIKALDAHFDHPHRKYKTIHIAGTNGKGSCSHTIAAILQSQGYKVGLFTSPHLVDFRERIRVNGTMASKEYVVDFVEKNRAFFEQLHPSFFELTTIMAFQYFAEQKVDYAVIEVGLGGRLDSTNIITPELSIITNISFDHTQFLGDTLPKIAKEKAGIIKPHIPVVIGEYNEETAPVFRKVAQQNESPILFAQQKGVNLYCQPCDTQNEQVSKQGDAASLKMHYHTNYGNIEGELTGNYQINNANTIMAALSLMKVDEGAIAKGFAHVCELTGLRGRWERLSQHPLTVCDTGHNLAGWQYLAPQIDAIDAKTKHIVFGMVDDKDIEAVLNILPRNKTKFYWTQASTHRAIPVEKIQQLALKHHLKGDTYPTVKQAFEAARAAAQHDDFIFVGGSSYVVADLLS